MTTRINERDQLIRSLRLSPIASIVTDPRGGDNPIISVNQPFELLTGYAESELIGRNCRILTGPDTEHGRSDELGRAIAAKTPRVVELINYRKDGSKFLNAVMIAPVFDGDGELAYFVGSQMEVESPRGDAARLSAVERIRTLTRQQQAVLRLMARGIRNRQIGEELGLTEKTIKMHRGAMVRRLGVTTTAEAMRIAIEAGF